MKHTGWRQHDFKRPVLVLVVEAHVQADGSVVALQLAERGVHRLPTVPAPFR
jgi:hypothetical protein